MADNELGGSLALVADQRRRQLVRQLRDETETTVDELAEHLHEKGPPSGDDQRTDRKGIAVRLSHIDLPKLADHGIVEYDHESSTVQYQSHARVEALLDSLPSGGSQTAQRSAESSR